MTAPDHTLKPFKKTTCTNGGIHTCTNGLSGVILCSGARLESETSCIFPVGKRLNAGNTEPR